MSRHGRVVWSEGMLLSPQHFQQWDRFAHHVLDARFRAFAPFGWGFTRLEVDKDALRNGKIGLLGAHGVFPDGTPFAVPEDDAAPVPRTIEGHFGSRQESLAVSLGVPSTRLGRPQLGEAAHPGTPGPRYSAESLEIAEDNDGSSSRPVTLARRNLCMLFPEDALDEHDVLAVAEIKRSSEGVYHLREDCVPPCVSIGASEYLVSRVRSIFEGLVTKSNELSAKRRIHGGVADFSVSDLTSFGQLYTVNACIPAIDHWLSHGRAHPEQVYQALTLLAGELCTFSPDHASKSLPRYDHDALGVTFHELHGLIMDLLRKGPETTAVRIDLKQEEDSIYVGRIEDPRLLESSAMLYLGASAQIEKDRLLRDVPIKIKVASRSQINRIVELALPGVSLTYIQDTPAALPTRPNYFYFKLNPAGDVWEGIRGAKNIAIFAPSDIPALSLDLVGQRG